MCVMYNHELNRVICVLSRLHRKIKNTKNLQPGTKKGEIPIIVCVQNYCRDGSKSRT